MSASNWTICPRCADEQRKLKDDAFEEAAKAYGVVDRDTYLAMLRNAENMPSVPKETFREDYEIYGARHGILQIEYGGRCTECDLEASFSTDVEFYERNT